jgi:uncharacterized protein with HEPN domain
LTRDFRDYLDDMVEAATKAREFVKDMSWDQFFGDEKTQFAAARALEIVGEAARNVPQEFRTLCPEVPWQRVVGMRNILAHNYEGADPRVIFDTINIAIPDLLKILPSVIAKAAKMEP